MSIVIHILAYWLLASIIFGAVWAFVGYRWTCIYGASE